MNQLERTRGTRASRRGIVRKFGGFGFETGNAISVEVSVLEDLHFLESVTGNMTECQMPVAGAYRLDEGELKVRLERRFVE